MSLWALFEPLKQLNHAGDLITVMACVSGSSSSLLPSHRQAFPVHGDCFPSLPPPSLGGLDNMGAHIPERMHALHQAAYLKSRISNLLHTFQIQQCQPGPVTKPANSMWDSLGTHKLYLIPAHISFQTLTTQSESWPATTFYSQCHQEGFDKCIKRSNTLELCFV